jgi:hypothetical protein
MCNPERYGYFVDFVKENNMWDGTSSFYFLKRVIQPLEKIKRPFCCVCFREVEKDPSKFYFEFEPDRNNELFCYENRDIYSFKQYFLQCECHADGKPTICCPECYEKRKNHCFPVVDSLEYKIYIHISKIDDDVDDNNDELEQ